MLTEDERVIVRIWTSQENKIYPGTSVGHVSIETPESYVSLWPVPFTKSQRAQYQQANTLKQQYLKYFMEREADYKQSFEDDCKAEGENPQVTLCFYSLKPSRINNEMFSLKKQTNTWRLIGSNLFVEKLKEAVPSALNNIKLFKDNKKKPSESCASFALKILKAGCLESLVRLEKWTSFTSKTSSFVKPDDLLEVLIVAKQAELKKYKETRDFTYTEETHLQEKDTPRCSIF